MENFIDERIIYPLHNAMQGGIYFYTRDLQSALFHCKQEDGMDIFHEKMKPYYRMYFEANPVMFQHGSCWEVRRFILMAMKEDELFLSWFSDNFCLWKVVHDWSEYYRKGKPDSKEFMELLSCLLSKGYECDWESHANELKHVLLREEIEGNQHSRSVYCMFHGYVTISWYMCSRQEKIALYEQFYNRWFVLRFLYSAMFRCIIGCSFVNFVQISNQMKSCVDYHPFLHLFYPIVMEQKVVICERGAKRDKLEASLEKIRVIASKEPSDELNVLCDILFPKVWKDYIEKHRLKDYKQLENEFEIFKKEMNERMAQMNAQILGMAEQLRAMAGASVPISVIEQELLELSPGIAWDVFIQLNGMLVENEAWIKYAGEIRKKIRNRMKKSEPIIKTEKYYAPGSNHYDESRNISITNDNKQLK